MSDACFLGFVIGGSILGFGCLVCLIVDINRSARIRREDELAEQINQRVDKKLDQFMEQTQSEHERFQREALEQTKTAWQAVQEMVSTARDLAYLEQNRK